MEDPLRGCARPLTVDLLLVVGEAKVWQSVPDWEESLKYRLAELASKRRTNRNAFVFVALAFTMCSTVMLSSLLFGSYWWGFLSGVFAVVSIFCLFTIWAIWPSFGKIDGLTTRLKRVGINYNVYMYQKQMTHDFPSQA